MATKKAVSKKAGKKHSWGHVIFGTLLLFALGVGLITTYRAGATRQKHEIAKTLASGAQLEASRAAITKTYLTDGAANADCTAAGSTPVSAETFYKYLRVNMHNDRAVIRGCNDADYLLAKIDGTWQKTAVSVNLSLRANPEWQQACDVQDITKADTKVRSENQSIDAANLKACNALADGKNLTFDEL